MHAGVFVIVSVLTNAQIIEAVDYLALRRQRNRCKVRLP